MSDERTSVLIVDDSSLMRAALSQMIDQQADMEVAGTAATGHEAVRKAVELQPEIVLMDIHMPDMDGIQAAWLVSSRLSAGAVIMATSEERVDFLQKAMAAGAQGYVLKPFSDGTKLLQTIRDVRQRVRARRVPVGGPAVPPPARPPTGRRIAVCSAKGGVGRTTIAVGLALALRQQTKENVALLDADFQFGDVNIHLDLPAERSIVDLIPHMNALDSRLVKGVVSSHTSGVDLLSRPPRPEQADMVTAAHVRSLLTTLAQMYEHLVIDTQLSYDDRMLAVLDSPTTIACWPYSTWRTSMWS